MITSESGLPIRWTNLAHQLDLHHLGENLGILTLNTVALTTACLMQIKQGIERYGEHCAQRYKPTKDYYYYLSCSK